ncbi:MAG: glycosyltransferase family 39 protein [Phycisphaerales bacterium]|nr:glycosyltransferase family 39 protein [Phycisphaerales bacterium]MCB9862331.1 glycosyltransferase family 39 protein [Phycisphaerales bacterium]
MAISTSRRSSLVCFGLIVACSCVAFTTLGDWAVLSPDSFGYLSVARSIAEIGELPAQRLTLPPGLSLLLAPMMLSGDAPLLLLRILLVAGWSAGSVLTYVYYRRELGERWAVAAALIVATCPAFLTQSAHILSELVFVPFVMASLVMMQSWRRAASLQIARVLVCGLLVALAMMVRTMGVALIPVGAALLLSRRGSGWGRRSALVSLFLIAPLISQAAWSWRNSQYEGGYGYREILTHPRHGEPVDAGPIALQFDRAMRYGPERLGTIEEAVIPSHLGWRLLQPPLQSWARWLVGGGLLLICVYRLGTRRSEADAFALLLFGILAIWPWNEGPRFVLPMLPVFAGSCVALLVGVRPIRSEQPDFGELSRCRRGISWCVIGIVLVVQLVEVGLIARSAVGRREKERDRVATMRVVGDWIADNVRVDRPIACVMPNESYAKTIAIGAAYFANRRISFFVDVFAGDSVNWAQLGQFDVLTVDSLTGTDQKECVVLPASDSDGRRLLMIRSTRSDPTFSLN